MARGFHDGLARVLLWRTDSLNRFLGLSSTLANGATSGAYVAENAIAARFNPTRVETKLLRGGDKEAVAKIQYGSPLQGGFDVVISDTDTALIAMLSGMTVNSVLNAYWDFYSTNPNLTFSLTGGCAVQQRNVKTDGSQYWHTEFFPACQFRVTLGGAEYRGDAPTTVSVTPSLSLYAHTGQTFGTGANNWVLNNEADKTDSYHIDSPDPLYVVAFRKDGTATTFNTVYKPLSTAVTITNTGNFNVINNVPTALSSITLAGVATVAAATAADLDILTLATNYVPV